MLLPFSNGRAFPAVSVSPRRQKKNQEDKITKRRLELEKAETRQVEVAKDWRLDFLNYHLQKNDMDKLKPNQDLNDNIVNFFLSMISTYMLD